MKIVTYDNARQMLAKTGHVLEKAEAENNLALGLLYSLSDKERKGVVSGNKSFFAAVEENGCPVFTMMITVQHSNLIVSGEGSRLEEAVGTAVSYLLDANITVPGVIGSSETASLFARTWAAQTHCSPVVKMSQRIYSLEKVNDIPLSPGMLHLADRNDLEAVKEWIAGFYHCLGDPIPSETAEKKAAESIAEGTLYLWEDRLPVSMAKITRAMKNGAAIGLVYTPPVYRGCGYASSCVTALSRKILNDGYQYCTLYTDLSNPTSNHIYGKIGYCPVQDSVVYRFA